MIGASGAISAVVGAYALLYGERRAQAIGPVPAGVVHVAWLAAAWIGIQLLIGLAGLAAWPRRDRRAYRRVRRAGAARPLLPGATGRLACWLGADRRRPGRRVLTVDGGTDGAGR